MCCSAIFTTLPPSLSRTGGPWLVTDMRRGESLFDVDINANVSQFRV